MTIDDIIEGVLKAEGRYVNNPDDRGGETNWGITKAVARANGYNGSMRDLPRATAKQIYLNRYVIQPGYDKIAVLSPSIAAELVDTGVNMGPAVASRFLQRALNALNRQGSDYADIAVDGAAGPGTRTALTKYLAKRGADGERRLLALLNALQGARYVELCEGRQANETFMFGWLARIAA
jgi:lysozyme family protein